MVTKDNADSRYESEENNTFLENKMLLPRSSSTGTAAFLW